MQETYLTIESASTGLYKEKGSKFLAYAYPVESEEEIKNHITALQKEHFGARHHCYAYRMGVEGQIWRANDNGEPSSTAGKPIYGQLISHNLTNTLVVVVRYFGGIKLGVSGLINAYRSATADALDSAVIIEKEAREIIVVESTYEQLSSVMKIIKDQRLEVVNQCLDSICRIELSVRPSKANELREQGFAK